MEKIKHIFILSHTVLRLPVKLFNHPLQVTFVFSFWFWRQVFFAFFFLPIQSLKHFKTYFMVWIITNFNLMKIHVLVDILIAVVLLDFVFEPLYRRHRRDLFLIQLHQMGPPKLLILTKWKCLFWVLLLCLLHLTCLLHGLLHLTCLYETFGSP